MVVRVQQYKNLKNLQLSGLQPIESPPKTSAKVKRPKIQAAIDEVMTTAARK